MRKLDGAMIDLLAWILPLNPQDRHVNICAKRLKGTGEWFTSMTEFQEWRDSSKKSNLFGCYGVPGAGKTVIW
jgi:hypothetical protein